jgi:hypothetical protein
VTAILDSGTTLPVDDTEERDVHETVHATAAAGSMKVLCCSTRSAVSEPETMLSAFFVDPPRSRPVRRTGWGAADVGDRDAHD